MKPDFREIATTGDGRDITAFFGEMRHTNDQILKQRGGGDLKLYEEVRSDPQVGSVFDVRQRALVSKEFIVEPGGTRAIDRAAADSVRAQLNALSWDRVTKLMQWGVFYGYAVAEMMYARDGREVVLSDIRVRNRRRFKYAADGSLRLLTPANPSIGEALPQRKFWAYSTGADNDDDVYGLALAHWLYWPVYFKRSGLRAWLIYLDKFGMPTGLGRYDIGATAEEKAGLLDAAYRIQSDSGIIIPKGMELELLEASRSGSADYKSLHDSMDQTIAKVVLGQVMTTEAVGGQYKAEVQSQIAEDIVEADDDLLSESAMRSWVRWLTDWNYPTAATPLIYRQVRNDEDANKRADRDNKIVSMGYRPTLKHIVDTYGGEWLPIEQQTAVQKSGALSDFSGGGEASVAGWVADMAKIARATALQRAQNPATCHAPADFAENPENPDYVDNLSAALADLSPLSTLIDKAKSAVSSSRSYDDLNAMLAKLYDIALDDAAQVIGEYSAAATLAGRIDAREESQRA